MDELHPQLEKLIDTYSMVNVKIFTDGSIILEIDRRLKALNMLIAEREYEVREHKDTRAYICRKCAERKL